jgi:hypothetical protein
VTESINVGASGIDKEDTLEFFNNFFQQELTVSSALDSALIAHFEKTTNNPDAARTLAAAVLLTCAAQGFDPKEIFDRLKQLPPGSLDAYTAMFLNLQRVGTSLLGVSNRPPTSPYVQRTVLS